MYHLFLTQDDVDTIAFIGSRYSWSSSLAQYAPGDNYIPESDAWTIKDAIDDDMEGGHDGLPMLDGRSDLAYTLSDLYESII